MANIPPPISQGSFGEISKPEPQAVEKKALPGSRVGRKETQERVDELLVRKTIGLEARRRIEGEKYLKITPEKVYSPLWNYAIGSLKGEKPSRSFIPIAVKFGVETTADKKQKTPELAALVYARAMLAFKQRDFAQVLANYSESTMSTFARRGFNQMAWQFYDPKNITALDLQARRRMNPEAIFTGLSDQIKMKQMAEKAYKFANLETGKLFNPLLSSEEIGYLAKVRKEAKHMWRVVRQEQFSGKKSVYKNKKVQMLFTAAGKVAGAWSQIKLRVLGPLNRLLPLHSLTWTAKYVLAGTAFALTFSAYGAVKLLGKVSSCAKKALFPLKEAADQEILKTENISL